MCSMLTCLRPFLRVRSGPLFFVWIGSCHGSKPVQTFKNMDRSIDMYHANFTQHNKKMYYMAPPYQPITVAFMPSY